MLAYVDYPGISSGPTGAINGRTEHLELGVRMLTNYITRLPLEPTDSDDDYTLNPDGHLSP